MLATMRPVVREGEFVFVSLTKPPDVECLATVVEDEGVTCVVRRATADEQGWPYDFLAGWITLKVHSALAGVGLTAAVSVALAEQDISCNVIAGYFHDHLLVPIDRRDVAIEVLRELSSASD
jgi:hypothetical protein